MELVDLFPRTIAVASLNSLTQDVAEKAIELIDFNCDQSDLESDGSYTKEQHILDKAIFREVKAEILQLCLEYANSLSHIVERVGICNSWGNVITANQSIRLHKHNNSYISGSFYLTEGSDFNIWNDSFNESFGMMPAIRKNDGNYRAFESFSIAPKPGRVILFPSGMYHSVLPEKSHIKRYSVAFNAIPLGRVGIPTGLMDIELN